MRRYPKYKDSGVEWIGEIPDGWDKKRIRNIGVMYGGLSGKSGDDFRRDEDDSTNKPFIPFTNICNNTYINKNELKLVSINENDNQNRVLKHDLFFMMTSENQEDVGKTSVLKDDLGEVYLNTFCKGFRITDSDVDPLFLNYLLNGKVYRELLSIEGNGYTRINLRQDRVNEFIVLLPPLQEQQQIVTYLDQKTTLIDQIISNSEKKIELLKEQRTSTINHIVTKGLNPKVRMKDTGVEWIGEIPEGWGVSPLKFLGNFQNGISKGGEFFGTGFPFMNYGDVYKFDETPEFVDGKVESNSEERERYSVLRGDVFFTRTSESKDDIGVSSVCLKSIENCVFSGFVIRFRFFQETLIPNFSKYLFQSHWKKVFIESKMNIVTRSSLSQQVLGMVPIIIPTILEQNHIVTYLDQKTEEIDDLISSENKRIELLKDYRQSMISEVVTGKIKVTEN
jgi:type I restriction enzyme S subunit